MSKSKGGDNRDLEGLDEIISNLNQKIAEMTEASQEGLTEAGLFVQGEAQKEVPRATGNLANSAYIVSGDHNDRPAVEIGFTALYAPYVHENPRAGEGKLAGMTEEDKASFKKKLRSKERQVKTAVTGHWKFLENPIKRNVDYILQLIGNRARVR